MGKTRQTDETFSERLSMHIILYFFSFLKLFLPAWLSRPAPLPSSFPLSRRPIPPAARVDPDLHEVEQKVEAGPAEEEAQRPAQLAHQAEGVEGLELLHGLGQAVGVVDLKAGDMSKVPNSRIVMWNMKWEGNLI